MGSKIPKIKRLFFSRFTPWGKAMEGLVWGVEQQAQYPSQPLKISNKKLQYFLYII